MICVEDMWEENGAETKQSPRTRSGVCRRGSGAFQILPREVLPWLRCTLDGYYTTVSRPQQQHWRYVTIRGFTVLRYITLVHVSRETIRYNVNNHATITHILTLLIQHVTQTNLLLHTSCLSRHHP